MNNEQVCIEYKRTLEFLKISDDQAKDSSKITCFYTAILNHLHWLCNYEEESRKIKFDLLVGFNKDFSEFKGKAYPLNSISIKDMDDLEEMSTAVKNSLKSTLPLCNDSSNIFLCVDARKKALIVGTYYTELGKIDEAINGMLKSGYVFFHHLFGTTVLIQIEGNMLPVSFSYGNAREKLELPIHTGSVIDDCWNDLFYRIKRMVHGTICLIVSPEWEVEDDENFYKKATDEKRILELPSKKINISPFECVMFENYGDYEKDYSLFISMLNFDGVTIIDTDGYIRAYNGICILNPAKKYEGGARHQAYQQLIANSNSRYVGLYMQSQEGEVRFHSFKSGSENELQWFDPSVMSWTSEKYCKEIKTVKNKVSSSHEDKDLFELGSAAIELRDAHNEYYNFYNEPEKAENLLNKVKQFQPKFSDEYLSNNLLCFRHTVNALLLCKIGNIYGVSKKAQVYVNEALGIFKNYWKLYEQNNLYYDKYILKELSQIGLPYDNWMRFFGDKDVVFINKFATSEFYDMLKGFALMEFEED